MELTKDESGKRLWTVSGRIQALRVDRAHTSQVLLKRGQPNSIPLISICSIS